MAKPESLPGLKVIVTWPAVVVCAAVVVDPTSIEFFGSAGIDELVIRHERAATEQVPLRIVAAQEKVRARSR